VSAEETSSSDQQEPVPPLIYDQLAADWPQLYEAHLAELKEQAEQERLDQIDPADPLVVHPVVST
jgi:hypothetical protein